MNNEGIAEKIFQINPILKKWSRLNWFIYFLFIPIFLVVLYFLPDSIKYNLVLLSNNPNVINIFFNHYTHVNYTHILNNTLIYIVTVFLIFNIETSVKRFYILSLLIFLCLPIIISYMLLLLISSNFIMLGFSALNAGFIGYLIFSAYNFLKNRYDYIKLSFFSLIISLNLLLLCLINNFIFTITAVIGFMTVVLLIIDFHSILNLMHELRELIKKGSKDKIFELFYLLFFIFFTGVMCFSLPILMPSNTIGNNIILNNVGHYFGWMFGFIMPMFFDII